MRKLAELLSRFRRDERGAVALLLGLALVPLIGFGGAALDYSRATLIRTKLQTALDAALLGAAQGGAVNLSEEQLSDAVRSRLEPLVGSLQLKDISISARVDFTAGRFAAEVSGVVPTTLMSVLGKPSLPVGTAATAAWSIQDVEVALVLDNTGSMAETLGGSRRGGSGTSKIEALRTAAGNFVTFMKGLSGNKPDAIKIALVPFDTAVRLDNQLARSFWVVSDRDTQKNGWSGCVYDRDQPNDVLDTPSETSSAATLFRADPDRTKNNDCGLTPVQPLTSNLGSLSGVIGSMRAVGYTNLTIGLAWGWHVLTPSDPITNAAPLKSKTQKFIVFMTDGMNTKNRWTDSAKAIDARTAQICANIKRAEIQIYTIGTPDADAALLRSCASAPDMYYGITDGGELEPVFQRIASKISQLRLAQ
jgi:Flp pilus assembly protein TadG